METELLWKRILSSKFLLAVDGVPPMINMVYREDFNEHDANRFDLRNGPDGKVEVVDGVLSMEAYSNATGITRAYVYLNEDKADVKGDIGIEFTITRPKTSDHIMVWPGGTANYRYTDIRWFADVIHLYSVDVRLLMLMIMVLKQH